MVRNYKPNGKHKTWKSEEVDAAMQLIDQGSSIRSASIRTGIPRTTLHHKHKRRLLGIETKNGRYSVFSEEQENALSTYVQFMRTPGFGFSSLDIRRIAFDFAEQYEIKHPFNTTTRLAGTDWFSGFVKRNPEFSIRWRGHSLASQNETCTEFTKESNFNSDLPLTIPSYPFISETQFKEKMLGNSTSVIKEHGDELIKIAETSCQDLPQKYDINNGVSPIKIEPTEFGGNSHSNSNEFSLTIPPSPCVSDTVIKEEKSDRSSSEMQIVDELKPLPETLLQELSRKLDIDYATTHSNPIKIEPCELTEETSYSSVSLMSGHLPLSISEVVLKKKKVDHSLAIKPLHENQLNPISKTIETTRKLSLDNAALHSKLDIPVQLVHNPNKTEIDPYNLWYLLNSSPIPLQERTPKYTED